MKYQVFISSTYEDLHAQRDATVKSILEMGHIPVGMEMFSAADEEQWKVIARQIDEVDYYIVIVAHRYGSVGVDGISFTEKEYDYAISKGVPTLAFVLDEAAPWPNDQIDHETAPKQSLIAFKEKVKRKMVNFWTNKEDLQSKVSISLMKAVSLYPRPGWVRAEENVGTDVLKEITRLSNENAQLRGQMDAIAERKRSDRTTELEKSVDILIRNQRTAYVKDAKTRKWGDAIATTLYSIFSAIAPEMVSECEELKTGQAIALTITSDQYYTPNPVPTNYLSSWLSDLVALNLVQPSTKRHSVDDKTRYWSLTEYGLELHKHMRRIVLEKALTAKVELPEDPK